MNKEKIKQSTLLVFIIVGMFSCKKQSNNFEIQMFPETISLQGNPIEGITVMSGGNVNLTVIDTFLVIQKKEEKFLKVYSTKTHKFLSEYGSSGNGPNEFMAPYLLKQVNYDSDDNAPIISVYDFNRLSLNFINVFDLIKEKNGFHIQERLPNKSPYNIYFYFNDESFFLAKAEAGGRFIHYDRFTDDFKIIPYLPKVKFEIKKEYLSAVYRSAVAVNENKRLIVAAPLLLGEIDFFDLNGNYLRSTFFEDPNKLERELIISEETKIFDPTHYIVDIDSKGDYIYCLNYNNKQTDLSTNNPSEILNLKVLVFDWEGNPVKEYILQDKRYIESFAVDEKNQMIYAYCRDEKEMNNIIGYKMNDIP